MSKDKLKSDGPIIASREEGADLAEEILEEVSSDGQTIITIYHHYCKGCDICAEVCPKGTLKMVLATDRWEGSMVEIVDIDTCNACMLCENQCPDFAIEIRNLKKEAKKKEKKANV